MYLKETEAKPSQTYTVPTPSGISIVIRKTKREPICTSDTPDHFTLPAPLHAAFTYTKKTLVKAPSPLRQAA